MRKYLQAAGYKYSDQQNDMKDKQFYLVNASYQDGEAKTFNNMVLDRVETYSLFLKHFEADTFQSKLVTILQSAISDNVDVTIGTVVDTVNVENGYEVTLTFTIKGK